MSLIIDGHNLIGVLPGIQLGDPDDEARLLDRLRGYRARAGGASLIVFFDPGALPSASRDLSTPGLLVRFAAPGQTADDAILEFLQGRAEPGQYAVVTNDQGLAFRARLAGASTLPASTFAARLAPRRRGPPPVPQGPDPHDPRYADIYAGFLAAEKNRVRFDAEPVLDPTIWLERLYGDEIEEAARAARWLGQFGGRQALGPLRDALTHGDSRVRAAALLALGDLGDPAAAGDVRDALQGDPAGLARQAAAEALGRLGDATSMAPLEAAARADPKGRVRKAAREALAQVRARSPAGAGTGRGPA